VSLQGLTQVITGSAAYQQLLARARAGQSPRALGLPRTARAVMVAGLQQLGCPIVYVTSSVESSRMMADALSQLSLNNQMPMRFTEPNTAFYDTVAPVRDVITQRSMVLAELTSANNPPAARPPSLIVTGPRALMQPTMPAKRFKLLTRVIKRDDTLSLETMIGHWVRMGYENEQVVDRVGTFSRRGGIIDVWSPAHPSPVRIELFGNVADSIRTFDPGTQRSGAALNSVTIAPMDVTEEIRDQKLEIEDTQSPSLPSPIAHLQSLIDYLPDNALLIIDDEEELRNTWHGLEERAQRERETMLQSLEAEGQALQAEASLPYLTWDQFKGFIEKVNVLVLGQPDDGMLSAHPLAGQFKQPPHFAGQLTPLLDYLKATLSNRDAASRQSIVIVSRQSARLSELWSERNSALAAAPALDEQPQGGLHFVVGALPSGFVFGADDERQTTDINGNPPSSIILLTDAEIYGNVRPEWFMRGRARKAAPERAFADWQAGDAVVHEDYGIGIYRGLVKLTVAPTATLPRDAAEGANEREYLLLEYQDADRLYVPLHQLDRVTRYVGADDETPKLDKLGSGQWEKARQKAAGAAADIARDLLKLYAEREMVTRPPFSKDTPWQIELESSFPFIETDDQLRAIQDVKRDMEKANPMDRLVVGDVGFGKTEVALRAAFKAVQDGKQVAVLVPTTVLAQQHWNTFSRRLEAYPMHIDMLSRFRTAAEKKEVYAGLADGTIDIVIGTHGLTGKDVKFKNLGLLVIDEEHRFGVKAKEKLKQLRTEVDVLTLTATPIPRTLYLGLSGVRAISRIETAPAERLPIISFVGAWDDVVVQQAIRRELDRDGQVFFVHNRIQTIYLLEQKLRRLVPEATLMVAHGQMEERELSRIMNRFSDGKVNVLLCTNIIESGLDIPNANTILIDNADHFGLAELYQLRGRVGRSTIQAYAYFLHDRKGRMTEEARARLETLRESAGIGAGYSISMRDLELRGAGDMLGAKQSGHIASVGFDLYSRLLSREVSVLRALRDGMPMPPDAPKPVTIDLPLTVGLPENYIGDTQLRVQLYRRAASLDSEEKIRLFEEELEDRFGKLPAPARNLTYQLRLKLAAANLGIQGISTDGNRFTIRAEAFQRMNPARLQRMLGSDALIGKHQVSFLRSGTPEKWKERLMDVVKKLAEMAEQTVPPKPASAPRPATQVLEALENGEDADEDVGEDAAEEEDKLPPITQDVDW
jgi:transcription-repair coupling factor (superfamily II helicase)